MTGYISVTTELPEVSHSELLLWNGKWSRVGKYLGSLSGTNQFYSPHDDVLRGITHWMLIEPPEDD